VLDNAQIQHLVEQLDEMSSKTLSAANLLADQSVELL